MSDDDELRDEIRSTLSEGESVVVHTTEGDEKEMYVTGKNAEHLFELKPPFATIYDYYQIDLREEPTLHAYATEGVSYEEIDLGEIEEVEEV